MDIQMTSLAPLTRLPEGVIEDYVDCSSSCGLNFHILEAGRRPNQQQKLIVLIHGYPELAFSWRKIMLPLTKLGHHVVAADQRGYGRTTGWDMRPFPERDMEQFRYTQLVRDYVALVHALGYDYVDTIVGHDFGAVTAANCALIRPDFFRSVVIMSHPFGGSSNDPFATGRRSGADASPMKREPTEDERAPRDADIHNSLANLDPPRKHYKWYNCTSNAANEWDSPAQGIHEFLRGYFHLKSANNPVNKPYTLKGWIATELAKLPGYYVMPYELSMPETIARDMRSQDANTSKNFLPDEDLAVYAEEWRRTGFGGALTWYRPMTDAAYRPDMQVFAGKMIECPSTFISGAADWGNCQEPGALERFDETCSQFKGVTLIDGAGHWPQQEQPEPVVEAIFEFISKL